MVCPVVPGISHPSTSIGRVSSGLIIKQLPLCFEANTEDGPSLPTRTNDEFRPFMRRLPEFKFW
uniref:Uncharacterized protein n=1 Tax=Romanomermis culicivorax TaxID=13658 RepID=A0A915K5U1_ROMCU